MFKNSDKSHISGVVLWAKPHDLQYNFQNKMKISGTWGILKKFSKNFGKSVGNSF